MNRRVVKTAGVLAIAISTLVASAWTTAADDDKAKAETKKSSPGDAIVGKWWFPKRNGQMEITRVGDLYLGKVIDYEKPNAVDEHNPDPKLRTRPFVGVEMLKGFKYDPDKQRWAEGTIYDGDNGKTYSCTMKFEDGDQTKLHARGYIGVSLFGRTEIFTRLTKEELETGVVSVKKPEEPEPEKK